eukprot:TRINITY_DN1159_c1_g1_i1.p1 TRINITY_DN1159_c1_g1~~TRINITY_DN1159_c1_g1_i1.p1  ORF type:complete len:207 (+),score=25.85 TRINITY_DN1159_c1_g1_i1:106-726(+)
MSLVCLLSFAGQGAKQLATSLEENRSIDALDLSHNNIGLAGIEQLCNTLKDNDSITKLDLGGNQIGPEGAMVLANTIMISENVKLTTLRLHRSEIGVEGAKYLADALRHNKTLTHLGFAGNIRGVEIGLEGTKYVTDALQHNNTLTELDLTGNSVGFWNGIALGNRLREVVNSNVQHSLRHREIKVPLKNAKNGERKQKREVTIRY